MILIDCNVCGQRHRMGDCSGEKPKIDRDRSKAIKEAAKPLTIEMLDHPDLRAGYNAYMRDYMRKKRAKDKDKLK